MVYYTYDCRNRLIQAGDVTYTYDAENNRIGMSTGTVSETYVVDTVSSSLSRVLVTYRTEDGKDSVTTALYGNGLISETTTEDSGTETTYYHHYNHLGSTMYLTDETGEVAAVYSYGVYGELLSGNTSLTRYLYNGSYGVCTDANGLLYMRHRYYNPQTMRFINRDIVSGSMTNSQSLNRYCYVQGNPISYVDPFGLSPNENTAWVKGLHAVLGFCGMIPGIGFLFEFADGILYLTIDQNYAMGIACLLGAGSSMVFGGLSFYSVGKKACDLSKAAKLWQNGALMAQGCSNFLSNGYQFFTGCYDLYSQYASGKPFEAKDLLSIAFLGLNGLGALGGIAGIGFGVHGFNEALNMPATKVVNQNLIEGGSNTIDNRLVNNLSFDNGERIATTRQIRNYKEQMHSMGINVVVDKKGKVLTGDRAAGFDYATGTIYIKKKSGVIDLYHEGFHVEQYLDIGKENYASLGRLAREEYVYSRIMDSSSLFNEAELQGATNYITRIRRQYK
ncbi:MAG: zincin-like metallopeptidase toxin domain-containing protein [Lachnospiraceae bacterium]